MPARFSLMLPSQALLSQVGATRHSLTKMLLLTTLLLPTLRPRAREIKPERRRVPFESSSSLLRC